MRSDLHELNRLSWNEATRAHNAHKMDQAAFFREGGSTLFPEELELLGPLEGKSLLHLQCNAGQDTLSLAGLGARVTGVDISDEAIEFARGLSRESGIPATFHRSDIYEWFGRSSRFDLVFCSDGALCWLSDLPGWARGVARCLEPGGRLVVLEFHPVLMCFELDWSLKFPYFSAEAITQQDGVGDYVGPDLAPSGFAPRPEFKNSRPCYEFQWTTAELVTSVARAGLILERLVEYPYTNGWNAFERMRPLGDRRYGPPPELPELPLMLGLSARSGAG
jgi:SAM-dependent methyltransferase